ncbi:MAG: AMP-binding protein [Desulfobacteraceae bacterium]|nr:AMP-binding protein [Desulfobacteraceae bacterium]
MNLSQILYETAEKYPRKTAVIFEEHYYSFKHIADLIRIYAKLLKDIGVKKGDRVALQLPKSVDMILLHLANLSVGGITLPLNTGYKSDEVEYFLNNSQSSLLVTYEANYLRLKPVIDSVPRLKCMLADGEEHDDIIFLPTEKSKIRNPDEPEFPAHNDDIAMICYTSGTTGRSKGAMITHNNLVCNMKALKHAWQWTDNDILLHVLPLFHIHGLVVALHGSLNAGSTMLVHETFDPLRVWNTIEERKCTMLMGVPTMYHRLLNQWNTFRKKPDISSMRVFISGSAPLSEKDFKGFRDATGHTVLERYGMTETGMNTSNMFEVSGRKAKSAGFPLSGIELRVAEEDGEDVVPGRVGEVWIKGGNVFKGYWQMSEKTEESFTDGWFKTGDLGYQDPDDRMRLYLVGRSKELIITGGYNVYPKEVENVTDQYENVEESAVIGLPDEDFGEKTAAVVVLADKAKPVSAEEIILFCKDNLADYKCPKVVFFRDELPRNAMGKVQKQILKNEYE